jgi:hypothetical protein
MALTLEGTLRDKQIGQRLWVVLSKHRLYFKGRWFDLPDYFLTDYASVPDAAFDLIAPRDDQYDLAALWHDYLVRYRKILGIGLTFAHKAFNAIMLHLRTVTWKRRVMVAVVWAVNWAVAGDGQGQISYKITDAAMVLYAQAIKDSPQ